MDEGEPAPAHDPHRLVVRVVVGIALQHDGGAERGHGLDLDLRGRDRHHDRRLGAEPLRGEGDALGMVACRGGDDPAPELGGGEARHLVVRAADLEREDRLEVLPLQEELVAESSGQERRGLEGGLDGDVVDIGVEDGLQVVDLALRHG